MKVTGPITRAAYQESLWDNFTYYKNFIGVRITSIDVQFMDGTSQIIDGKNIIERSDLPTF